MEKYKLQKQGLYPNINPEITPNELLTLFRQPKIILNRFIESEN